jgi:hypothetical protein
MGHGRLGRSPFLYILLVLSSIQGITPDARDLASPVALKLLNPFPAGHNDLDDHGSPGEVCQAIQMAPSWHDRRMESPDRTTCPTTAGESLRRPGFKLILDFAGSGSFLHAAGLSVRLCRLQC